MERFISKAFKLADKGEGNIKTLFVRFDSGISSTNFKKDAKMNIGDTVIIVDNGKEYTTYETLYKKFGFSLKRWDKNVIHTNGTKGIIVGIDFHPIDLNKVYCIFAAGKYFMISENGIEKMRFIDNVAISETEFMIRTRNPEIIHELTHKEIEEILGYKVKIIK